MLPGSVPSARKRLSGLLRFLPLFGLVIAAVVLVLVRNAAREADATLAQSVAQQRDLREILWINLLVQRSANLKLAAGSTHDPAYFDRATAVAAALGVRSQEMLGAGMSNLSDGEQKVFRRATEDAIAHLNAETRGPRDTRLLLASLETTGSALNSIESQEWFKLNEHNAQLLRNIQDGLYALTGILGLFVCYLALLAWILRRNEKAEAALRQAEAKMHHSAKISALGEMSGGVAHEINNPLATISLLAEQVRESLEEGGENKAFALAGLAKISSTVKRIGAIVQALRSFSRDGSHDRLEDVAAQDLLDSTLCLCQEKFKLRGVQVRVHVASSALTIHCQQVPLSQVLLNLFNNAFDAIEAAPEKWIEVSASSDATGSVILRVSNSGPRIPDPLLERLFTPFFTTKEIGKGTGLGLSIAKGIVESHKGRIYVDRSSAHTSFVVEIPPGTPSRLKAAG
jgi:C4-dicarboxylate-specific signal transduction histidine kinase